MAGKFDFKMQTGAKLREDVGLVDLCILRFATWACDDTAEGCALCQQYLNADRGRCGPCPIARDGYENCEGTPYDDAADKAVPSEEMYYSGGDCPSWLTPDDCAAEVRYLLRLRGKLTNALVVKAAARAKKVAKAKAARKKAARG